MKNMKKYIISIFLLAIVVLYSAGVRHLQPKAGTQDLLTGNNRTAGGSGVNNAPNQKAPSAGGHKSSGQSGYKDGTYDGNAANAFYGSVQVEVTVSGGKITGVKFLQYPHTHSESVYINRQAMPVLQQEAITAQSASVDIVSGATFTSQAFIESMGNAIAKAKG